MTTPAIEFCRAYPEAMQSFHRLANRYGQNLESAVIIALGAGEVLAVRYQGGEPLAWIAKDGVIGMLIDEEAP